MNRRDWLIVGGLFAAAMVAGWPSIRNWPMMRYFRGECGWRCRTPPGLSP